MAPAGHVDREVLNAALGARKVLPTPTRNVLSIATIAFATCLCFNATLANNLAITLDDCDTTTDHVYAIDGAVIASRGDHQHRRNCTLAFRTKLPGLTFLVQLNSTEDSAVPGPCLDSLTFIDIEGPQRQSVLLDQLCQLQTSLTKTYSLGDTLALAWSSGAAAGPHSNFQLTLTAVQRQAALCQLSDMHCNSGDCISASLVCDGISHCYHGDDEDNCQLGSTLDASSVTVVTDRSNVSTTMSTQKAVVPSVKVATASQVPPDVEQVYLWLPLLVVVIFTGVMVTLIFVGRKEDEEEVTPGGATNSRNRRPAQHPKSDIYLLGARTILRTKFHSHIKAATAVPGTKQFTLVLLLLGNHVMLATAGTFPASSAATIHPANNNDENTPAPDGSADQQKFQQIDTISIIVVIVIFVVVLIICIVLGCRSKSDEPPRGVESTALTENDGNIRLQVNTGYTGSETGDPATPPPTYSMIERQTSYVSYISQTSSQMSVPPDYDEAFTFPDVEGGENNSTPLHRSVSRSGVQRSASRNNAPPRGGGSNISRPRRSASALLARARQRRYERSHSVAEANVHRNRSGFEATRESESERDSVLDDSVFTEVPSSEPSPSSTLSTQLETPSPVAGTATTTPGPVTSTPSADSVLASLSDSANHGNPPIFRIMAHDSSPDGEMELGENSQTALLGLDDTDISLVSMDMHQAEARDLEDVASTNNSANQRAGILPITEEDQPTN